MHAAGRKRREAELDSAVEAWTLGLSPDEAMAACQAAGAARDCRGHFAALRMAPRGHFVLLDHPDMGRYAGAVTSALPPDIR